MLLLKAILIWIIAVVTLVLLLEFLYWLAEKLEDGGQLVLAVLLLGAWVALSCLL